MEINRRVASTGLTAAAVVVGVLQVLGMYVISIGIDRVERERLREEVDDLRSRVDHHVEELRRFVLDRARWPETLSYVANRDPSYRRDHLSLEGMRATEVELFAVIDARGRWTVGVEDPDLRVAGGVAARLEALDIARVAPEAGEATAGLVAIDDRVFAIGLAGARNGRETSTILVARELTSQRLAVNKGGYEIEAQLSRWSSDGLHLPNDAWTADGRLRTVGPIRDLFGAPTVEAAVSGRPQLGDLWWSLAGWLLVVLVATASILLVLQLRVLDAILLQPLSRLDEMVRYVAIGQLRRVERVGASGDAVDRLRTAVNQLLDGLEQQSHEIATHHAALDVAWKAAESGARAKSDFLATISHEMRTPLNGIIAVTELLRERIIEPDLRAQLGIVHTSSETLLTLIEDVLDFSKLEEGRLSLDQQPCDLREVAEEVLSLVAVKVDRRAVEMALRIDAGAPRRLIADKVRLQQVLVNLIGNAAKFTRAGHIVLRITYIPDRIGRFRFEVEDTGPGVPADLLPRLFERFSRGDTAADRRAGGTGLGLAIARGLVRQMGGVIGVNSNPGRGSTFWFEVPLATATRSVTLPSDGPRVVVAAQHPDVGAQLVETLREAGFTPLLARSLDQVSTQLLRATDPARLLLLDDALHGVTDSTARELIRSMPALQVIRIAAADPGQASRGAAIRVLTRPVPSAVLLGAVREATEQGSHIPVFPVVAPSLPAPPTVPCDLRVLVVEDNRVNREVARMVLHRLGVTQVDLAENGREALEKVDARDYDLILMDCLMPDMDGYEASRALRAREMGRRTPICAITANAFEGDRARCLAAGMDDFIAKPLRAEALARVIERLVVTPRVEAV
jgi:signal transduction histidine kinase/DNA-binding response OmpR family regulator